VQRTVCVSVFAAAVLISCTMETPQDQVASSRALWDAASISNYDFSVEHFAAWSKPPPMRIVVRSNAVESATLLCHPPTTEDFCRLWQESWKERYGPDRLIEHARSITQLLDDAALRSRQDPDARVSFELDPTYGFPARYSINNLDVADDEYGFHIFDFKVVQ